MRAKKSFGQNFLIDEGTVSRIVRELDPREDETIVEIARHGEDVEVTGYTEEQRSDVRSVSP